MAQHGQLAFLDGQETQARPALAGSIGAADPEQVRADIDRDLPPGGALPASPIDQRIPVS